MVSLRVANVAAVGPLQKSAVKTDVRNGTDVAKTAIKPATP